MLAPKTYVGYDNTGNRVGSCTAVDATTYIDPAEVQAAINNVESVASEQMGLINTALNATTADADEAVIVQGTKMTSSIEEVFSALTSIPGSIKDSISSMYDAAVSAHDQIQEQANQDAYNTIKNTTGVTTVQG